MSSNPLEDLGSQIARAEELLDELVARVRNLKEDIRNVVHQPAHPSQRSGEESKTQFERIAEVLIGKWNRPMTTKAIMTETGISRGSLSQIIHRTHRDSFVSVAMQGYSRRKLWKLTDVAAAAATQLGSSEQRTLFGAEGDLTGVKAVDCCVRIMREHGNEPLNALTMAREAISRGYRGKAQGSEDEVLLTTAKSFWAALGRDERFQEVRPLVFVLKEKEE